MDVRRFSVSAHELKVECLRRKYRELLSQPDIFPSKENWDFIIDNAMTGLGEGLYRKFLVASLLDEDKRCDFHLLAIEKFPVYLKTVDRSYALEILYSDHSTMRDEFVRLVYECQLFDAGKIGDIIDAGIPDLAAELLDSYQPEYDGDAIDAMQFLLSKFDKIPSLGEIEIHKGLFKTERRYICPDGHVNPQDAIFCQTEGCGKDIRGLTESNLKAIERFADRIEILREMLD